MRWMRLVLWSAALLAGLSCQRHRGVKEPPITGRPADPPVAMRPRWESGRSYLHRVDSVTTALVPRRNSPKTIRAEITIGQDVSIFVTNALPDGSCVLELEVRSVQVEIAKDDEITVSFDSENRGVFMDESGAGERLQKLVGARLRLSLSGANKVTNVDGAREFAARMPRNVESLRGVAAGVIARAFNPQFYTEFIEMSLLPTEPVRVGATWTAIRQASTGLSGGLAPFSLTCAFRGWQRHDGTNCARVDFSGSPIARGGAPPDLLALNGKPPEAATTAQGQGREQGTIGGIAGRCWFNPDLALAAELSYEQSFRSSAPAARTSAATGTSNGPPNADGSPDGVASIVTNLVPAPNARTEPSLIFAEQRTSIRLIEVEPAGVR